MEYFLSRNHNSAAPRPPQLRCGVQVRELLEPAADCDPQNDVAHRLQALQILAALGAQMNQQMQPANTPLPAPVQLHADTNVFATTGLPNLQLQTDTLAALLRGHAQAVVSGMAASNSVIGSSAFSPVQPQEHQAPHASSAPAPALFKAQQNGHPVPAAPLSLALAQMLRTTPDAPAPAVPPSTAAASSAVLQSSNGSAAAVTAPANVLASDSYIPQSLLPKDPATQEIVMQDRREKLRRFQAKKRGRGAPSVRYASRKKYADSRPRVKGRFVRKTADDSAETPP